MVAVLPASQLSLSSYPPHTPSTPQPFPAASAPVQRPRGMCMLWGRGGRQRMEADRTVTFYLPSRPEGQGSFVLTRGPRVQVRPGLVLTKKSGGACCALPPSPSLVLLTKGARSRPSPHQRRSRLIGGTCTGAAGARPRRCVFTSRRAKVNPVPVTRVLKQRCGGPPSVN